MALRRCFVAVDFSIQDKKILHELGKETLTPFISRFKVNPSSVRLVPPQNIHLTLKFLGLLSDEQITAHLEEYSSDYDCLSIPKKITLTNLSFFDKKAEKVIWFDGDYGSLESSVSKITKGLTPHITIARLRGVDRVPTAGFEVQVTPISITLFESVLTPQGPIYTELAVIRELVASGKF